MRIPILLAALAMTAVVGGVALMSVAIGLIVLGVLLFAAAVLLYEIPEGKAPEEPRR